MADEGRAVANLTWTNGTRTTTKQFSITFDVTETVYAQGVLSVGTSDVQLDVGDVTTPGYALFYSHDATNYVEVGNWNGGTQVYLAKLTPDRPVAIMPLGVGATAISLKANTAACEVEYLVLGT